MTNDEVAKMLEKHKIPLGASAKTTANDTIQGAYLRLAQLYRERLSLYEKAIHAGETLLKRYPETTRKMRAYFALYQAHRDAGNSAQAEVYKQKILSEFGDSQIAKVLKNPDFANEKKVQDFIINQYYDDTYLAVQRGNFAQAKKMLDDVPTRFGQENSHRARFALLEAMTQGGLEGKNAYIKALNTIITSFPNTDEQDKAKRMLAAISDVKNNETTSTTEPQKTGDNENPAPFTLRLDLPHYVIVVFEQDAKLSPLKANITDYNAKYHAVKRLRVSTILLGLEYPALIVRRFRDGSKALEYLVEIQNNPDFLEGHNARYKLYTISQDNYKTVLTKRNFMFYDAFYKENYPQ